MYHRIKRFIKLIWNDVGLPPFQILKCIVVGMIAGSFMVGLSIFITHILCWITHVPFTGEATGAGIGTLLILIGFVIIGSYVRDKWQEAKLKSTKDK